MPRATSRCEFYVIIKGGQYSSLLDSFKSSYRAISSRVDGAVLNFKSNSVEDKSADVAILSRHKFIKIFEDAWVAPDFEESSSSNLVAIFFAAIAPKYEELIGRDWNVACYNYLYSQAAENWNPRTVLDFGCGTGLVLESSIPKPGVELLGYDQSDAMRQLANKRGLKTIDSVSLLNSTVYDLIICYYVLHYMIPENLFLALINSLALNGRFVANIHKGIGEDRYQRLCSSLKSDCFQYEFRDSSFGSILIVRRFGI